MNTEELKKLIEGKTIESVDLGGQELTGIDFSGCTLTDVNFKNATLRHCTFDEATLTDCDFDHSGEAAEPTLSSVSFRKATLQNCRFRYASISWSDFRYAVIDNATFEDSRIDFCDFYRCFLQGVVLFKHATISNSSLYNTYFGDAANIRRENLKNDRIVQQNKTLYRQFLCDWHNYGTGERTNNRSQKSEWDPADSLKARWADAEDIYKTLNGLWAGRGYFADANWAYVQGRKMERRRMMTELTGGKLKVGGWLNNVWKIFTNTLSDLFFGYGESMTKMILTYIVTVLLFAFFYSAEVSLPEYVDALAISLKNMVGMDSEVIQDVSPLVDMLNLVQTTVGILLTGIFGFILGNKIRNQ